ncbi:hypothetical protein ACWGII_30725 [Streptomyces sp. NPDC054855]
MSEQPWTIDAIAHALPIPDLRQNFLRAAHLATIDELPGVCRKWAGLVERYEADRPETQAVLEYARAHNGQLPPQYADDGSTDDFLVGLEADVRNRHSQGSNAA